MRAYLSFFAVSVMVAAACGPNGRDDDGLGSGSGSGSGSGTVAATLTGKVWAPKWAPGDVPPGQEIPIFGATIYVTDTQPQPIPQQTFCEACVDTPQGSVTSKHDGSFELPVTGTG